MYQVKRIEKGVVIEYNEVNTGRIKGIGKKVESVSFAVVDGNGEIAKNENGDYLIFSRKYAAEKMAEYCNS